VISGRKRRFCRSGRNRAAKSAPRRSKAAAVFVYPVVEKVDILKLELMTIDVQTPEVYTSKGVPVKWTVSRRSRSKATTFPSPQRQSSPEQGTDEIKNIAMQTLEGHLRAILGTMTVEEIYQNRDAFAAKVQEVAAGDMANMGLGNRKLFTIREHPRHTKAYLDALGKPRIAQSQTRRHHRPGRGPTAMR